MGGLDAFRTEAHRGLEHGDLNRYQNALLASHGGIISIYLPIVRKWFFTLTCSKLTMKRGVSGEGVHAIAVTSNSEVSQLPRGFGCGGTVAGLNAYTPLANSKPVPRRPTTAAD
jgi:hypothetical protein